MNWRSLFTIVLLAGLCVISLRALDQVSAALNQRPVANIPNVDYLLYGVTLVRYRPGEDEVMTLRTERAEHLRQERELRAYGVEVLQTAGPESWALVAPTAVLAETSDQVKLSGGVLVRRQRGEEGARMRSSVVNVDLKEQIVRTDRRVEVEDGRSILRGRGLVADLVKQRFEILHDAEVSYRPPERRSAVLQPNAVGAPGG